MHSMYYRRPAQFKGQRVLVVGARASGTDLAREISQEAAEVWACVCLCVLFF